jgi:geranylgeranyl pyrophosphate synthase
VIGGQAAELELQEGSPLEALRSMHAMKTGALFAAALLMPADLAGLDRGTPNGHALTDFALALGLAFQAVDDLEDAEQDRRQGKEPPLTSVLHYMSEKQAREQARAPLQAASEALFSAFGAEARGVLEIAAEVEGKL